jgi:hypothetical protein
MGNLKSSSSIFFKQKISERVFVIQNVYKRIKHKQNHRCFSAVLAKRHCISQKGRADAQRNAKGSKLYYHAQPIPNQQGGRTARSYTSSLIDRENYRRNIKRLPGRQDRRNKRRDLKNITKHLHHLLIASSEHSQDCDQHLWANIGPYQIFGLDG